MPMCTEMLPDPAHHENHRQPAPTVPSLVVESFTCSHEVQPQTTVQFLLKSTHGFSPMPRCLGGLEALLRWR